MAPHSLEIGRPGSATVTLPDTVPMSVDVSWHDGDRTRHRRISFRAGEVVTVAVPADDVELETLAGDRYRLVIPRHGVRSGMPVAGFNFSPVRAALRSCLGRDRLRDRVVRLLHEPGANVVLTGPAGCGKTVLLGAVLDQLDADGFGVVQHFYGTRPTWDEPDYVNASLRAKVEALRGPQQPPSGVRRALVVAVREHVDPALESLFRRGDEAEDLAGVLRNAAVGNFDVDVLISPTADEMRRAIDSFGREPGGLQLLYLACLAVRDDSGSIFFAMSDTRADRLNSTALADLGIKAWLQGSAADDAVVVLDCLANWVATAEDPRAWTLRPGTPPHGSLTVIASFDTVRPHRLTRALIEGLGRGTADLNGDGSITLDELLEFTRDFAPRVWVNTAGLSSPVIAGPSWMPPVVVALDNLPEEPQRAAEVTRILVEHPGSRLIVTARQAPSGMPIDVGVPDDLERVCLAMLDRHRAALAMAFDRPPDPIPFAAELVAAAGRLPGRLAAIIEWILDRPPGAARIDDLPPPLTVGYADVWRSLQRPQQLTLDFVAAGRSPTTVAELLALLPAVYAVDRSVPSSPALRRADVRRLVEMRLLHLDGPIDAPGTVVSLSHPAVTADSPGSVQTLQHSLHVAAFPHFDPATVLPAQLADAAHHHAAHGDPEWSGRLVRCGAYLDLRQRTAGVDALIDDLALLADQHEDAALMHRTVVGLAAHLRAEPESFVDLVHGGLSAVGQSDLARKVFDDWARPALTVRAVHAVEPDRLVWTDDTPVLGAARWPDGSIVTVDALTVRYHDVSGMLSSQGGPVLDRAAPATVATLPTGLAIAQRATVWLFDGERSTAVSVGESEVTCLFAEADVITVGRADGTATLLTLTADGPVLRKLLGHHGAVTAIGRAGDRLLTASADATVRIWSPAGETLRIYRRHHASVVALATIGDDEVLTADEKGRLRWWDAGTCTDVGMLRCHEGSVTGVAFAMGAPVTVGVDGAVLRHGLDASADRPFRTVGPPVTALATSRWGQVAVWTAGGALTVWDRSGEAWSRHPEGVRAPVRALVFDEAGTLVIAHAGGLTAYDGTTQPRGGAHLGALTFASGESVVAGTTTGAVTVELATGRTTALTGPAPATSVAAGREGNVVTVDSNGVVHTAFDASMAAAVRRVIHGDEIHGRFWLHTQSDELVEVTDLDPFTLGTRRVPVGPDTTAVASSVFGDDWIAAGDRHGTVTATRLATGPETSVHRVGAGAVGALVFGRLARDCLVVGSADGSVHRYILDEQLLIGGPFPPVRIGRHRGAVTGLAVEPFHTDTDEPGPEGMMAVRLGRDHVVSSGTDGTVRLWDLLGARQVGVVAGPSSFRAVDIVGSTVVARDGEGRLWVLDAVPRHAPPGRADLTATDVIAGADPGAVTMELEISTPVSVDVRAVHLTDDRPLPTVPGALPRLTLSGRTVPVAADGSLPVPQRLRPGTIYRFVVSQDLLPSASRPDERTLTLQLTVTPTGAAAELTAAFRLNSVPTPGADQT
jgi:WD40 repeat protein